MGRARWKRKNVRDELTGKAVNSPKTGTGRHELLTELETPLPAALYLNLKSVRRRICGHGAQRGANRTPLLLFPLPLPRPTPGGVSKGGASPRPPSPGVGFQRRGQGPACLCRFKGVRKSKSPRFSLGGRGTFSFKREYPLASRPGNRDCPLWEQRKCGGHSARKSRVIHAPHSGALVLLDQFKMD